jgi:hypothetical protein
MQRSAATANDIVSSTAMVIVTPTVDTTYFVRQLNSAAANYGSTTYGLPWIYVEDFTSTSISASTFAANNISSTPTGFITATTVQGALDQIGSSTPSKITQLVNADTDVTLGNLKFRLGTSPRTDLQVSTVSGTLDLRGSCTGSDNGVPTAAKANITATTTPQYLAPASTANYSDFGDTVTYLLQHAASQLVLRVTCIVGKGYVNNSITIERLT